MPVSELDSWYQEFSWEGNGSGSDSGSDGVQYFLRQMSCLDLFPYQMLSFVNIKLQE